MKPVFPPSGFFEEITSWVNGPYPPEVLRVAEVLTEGRARPVRALVIGYTLRDAGLLASDDRTIVELPFPTYRPGDEGELIPSWEIPEGVVSARNGWIEYDGGYFTDLDAEEQRALGILAAVAHARLADAQTVGDEA